MKLTKSLAAIGVSAMMVMSVGALAGCNAANEANEEVIREAITQELDPYKNHDSRAVDQIRSQNAVALATVGIDGEQYAEALLDGFDYAIEDVTVDGNNATATLVMTQKNIDENEAEAIMEELVEDPAFVAMTDDERKAAVGEKIFEYIESVPSAPQDPVELEFVMEGNMWNLTDDSKTKMESLFTF